MSRPEPTRAARTTVTRALGAVAALLFVLLSGLPAAAADPSPSVAQPADLRMSAQPLLGGTVRPGAWMAVRVHLENDGPAVAGELRIGGGQQGDSRYGAEVELPTGARQEHILYAQPAWFGSALSVTLVSGGKALISQRLTTHAVDAWTPTIVVVAEHPEGIVADIRVGSTVPNLNPPVIITVKPADLPPRVEAWSAIDRVVWQDVDTSSLSKEQIEALRAWIGAGGRLVVVGGSTGTTTLGAFPVDLLPFTPTLTVDVPTTDLVGLLGPLPEGAQALPGISGLLDAGTVMGRSGDHVFAAQRSIGQGTVTLIGIDPSTAWLTGTHTATALWRRLLPAAVNGAVINPLVLQDDSQIVSALGNLPAVDLPDLGVLFGLLLLYIALIGPINYLVLRRLDRREWAWVTMPVLVGIFAVAAWGLGVNLKGTDTIVNQVGIVRSATGTDQGIGQYYVGIFSPTRATYEVNVADAALLTNPTYLQSQGQAIVPLDVVTGETSRLRDFQVGFAVLRTFRAEAAVPVPHLDAALRYADGVLTGTLTNRSTQPLETLAIEWGGAVQVIDTLAPGVAADVKLRVAATVNQGQGLSELVYGTWPATGSPSRTEMTRRLVLDQLWWSGGMGNGAVQQGPIIFAWTSGPGIGVALGAPAKSVGDTLTLYPAPFVVSGPTVWPNGLMGHSVISSTANDATDQGTGLSLSRGTMTVEMRPMGFGGPFTASRLSLMLTQGELPSLSGRGPEIQPLPMDQQPPQDDPLNAITLIAGGDGTAFAGDVVKGGGPGAAPDPAVPVAVPAAVPAWDGIPDLQLFDRVAQLWVEFPHSPAHREFNIASPERYVDDSGAFLVRFLNRGGQDMSTWFSPLVRLEGDAG